MRWCVISTRLVWTIFNSNLSALALFISLRAHTHIFYLSYANTPPQTCTNIALPLILSVSYVSVVFSAHFTLTGALHARVQIQRVSVWELLRDLLVNDLSAAAVGPRLVPGFQQRGSNHEGQPCKEDQAGCTLHPQTSQRFVQVYSTPIVRLMAF